MKIFGLNINFADFFTQLGHAVTIGLGVAGATGLIDPHAAANVSNAIDSVPVVINSAATSIHSLGWGGIALGILNLILHNSTPSDPTK